MQQQTGGNSTSRLKLLLFSAIQSNRAYEMIAIMVLLFLPSNYVVR